MQGSTPSVSATPTRAGRVFAVKNESFLRRIFGILIRCMEAAEDLPLPFSHYPLFPYRKPVFALVTIGRMRKQRQGAGMPF